MGIDVFVGQWSGHAWVCGREIGSPEHQEAAQLHRQSRAPLTQEWSQTMAPSPAHLKVRLTVCSSDCLAGEMQPFKWLRIVVRGQIL